MSKPNEMPLVMFEHLPPEGRLKTWARRTFRRPRKFFKVVLPIPPAWKVPQAGQTLAVARGVPVRLPQEALVVAAACPPHMNYRFRVIGERNDPCSCGSGKKTKKCGCLNAVLNSIGQGCQNNSYVKKLARGYV